MYVRLGTRSNKIILNIFEDKERYEKPNTLRIELLMYEHEHKDMFKIENMQVFLEIVSTASHL